MRFLKYLRNNKTYRHHLLSFNAFNLAGIFLAAAAAHCSSDSTFLRIAFAIAAVAYVQFWSQLKASIDRQDSFRCAVESGSAFVHGVIGRVAQIQRFAKRLAAMSRVVVILTPGHERDDLRNEFGYIKSAFSPDDNLVISLFVDTDNPECDFLRFSLVKGHFHEAWWRLYEVTGWRVRERVEVKQLLRGDGKYSLWILRKDLMRGMNQAGDDCDSICRCVNVTFKENDNGALRVQKDKGEDIAAWMSAQMGA